MGAKVLCDRTVGTGHYIVVLVAQALYILGDLERLTNDSHAPLGSRKSPNTVPSARVRPQTRRPSRRRAMMKPFRARFGLWESP